MQSEVAALFLNHSACKLDQATKDLAACMAKLNQDQLWHRGAPHENAIGNLILHMCGNMRQWIIHGVGGAPDVRMRDKEFSSSQNFAAKQLVDCFESTVAEAKTVIADLPHGRLAEHIHPQNRDVLVIEAVYQVVGHVQQHMGQIILLTKQISGQDLDLTIPRPR